MYAAVRQQIVVVARERFSYTTRLSFLGFKLRYAGLELFNLAFELRQLLVLLFENRVELRYLTAADRRLLSSR